MLLQNDQAVNLTVGDAALVDSARPFAHVLESGHGQFGLQLPRQSLVAHLGFDPQGGILRRGETVSGGLTFALLRGTGPTIRPPVLPSRPQPHPTVAITLSPPPLLLHPHSPPTLLPTS